jgi:hypothetical protein
MDSLLESLVKPDHPPNSIFGSIFFEFSVSHEIKNPKINVNKINFFIS